MSYERKGEKVKPGIYRVYNGSPVEVIMMVPEPDTGKEFVICKKWRFVRNKDYFVVSKENFYSEIEDQYGKKHQRYKYTDFYEEQASNLEDIEEDGFNVRDRIVRIYEKAHRFDDSYLKHRTLRSSSSYVDYAKDIFEHITEDRARIQLCRNEKLYIGLKKEEFKILAEDLRYFDLCMKGPLAPYAEFFSERFGENPISIREYAAAHNINRGSVEHIQRKMIRTFAEELKKRDDADGVKRIHEPVSLDYDVDEEEDEGIETEEKQVSDEEFVLNLITDVLDHNMTESEINNAVDDRFGIGNIENQLCNEACQLLWAYLNSGGEFYLKEWFTIKERLQKRIAEQNKV